MNSSKQKENESYAFFLGKNMLVASAAAMWAECLTIPFDTAKVRLQIQKVEPGKEPRYKGIVQTCRVISAEEGVIKLWNGIAPGLQRQFIFAGLRIGLYTPIRDLICGPLPEGVNPTLVQKIMAGFATGAIGITIANPTDLVKVKMQGQGVAVLEGKPLLYKNSFDCYRRLVAEGGIANLWTGIGPNIMRNCIVNAAELASYDQYKQYALGSGYFRDNALCHVICASATGLTACCVGSPVDVLKTRVMNATPGLYSSTLDCAVKTMKNEGVGAFYKGFVPNAIRLSSWNVTAFLTLEFLRKNFLS